MIRNTLFALAATATLVSGLAATTATSAQAKTTITLSGALCGGCGGGYDDSYDDSYDDYGGYDSSCYWDYQTFKKWNWNHTHFKWKHKKVWVCY